MRLSLLTHRATATIASLTSPRPVISSCCANIIAHRRPHGTTARLRATRLDPAYSNNRSPCGALHLCAPITISQAGQPDGREPELTAMTPTFAPLGTPQASSVGPRPSCSSGTRVAATYRAVSHSYPDLTAQLPCHHREERVHARRLYILHVPVRRANQRVVRPPSIVTRVPDVSCKYSPRPPRVDPESGKSGGDQYRFFA